MAGLAPSNRAPHGRTAALAKASDLRAGRLRGTFGIPGGWQQQIIRYDREGPSMVGVYLDAKARLASLCPLVPGVMQDDGTWVRSEDPVLIAALRGYRSRYMSQSELVFTHVRARAGVGEAWIIESRDLGYTIVTVNNVAHGGADEVIWTDMFGVQRRTPGDRVWRSWVRDPYEPSLATSDLRRTIPDLRRIHSAVRSQSRAADSRLLSNGILAFKPDSAAAQKPLAPEAEEDDQEQSVIDSYYDIVDLGHRDDDSFAATAPFAMFAESAPEFVDVGRGIDEYVMDMEKAGIEAFARGVNFPAQLLVDGPGASNHWNEWVLQEVQLKTGLAPDLEPVCEDITEFYYRPMLRAFQEQSWKLGEWEVDPDRVRAQPDYSFLASKPDKTAHVLQAWAAGLIDRKEAQETLGYPEGLELPAGLTEFEFWELANNKAQAPYVAVDGNNQVEVPEAFEEEAPVDAEIVDEPMPEALPAGEDGWGQAAADEPSAVQEGPPPAPAVAAAVFLPETDEVDVGPLNDLLEQLGRIDRDLALQLGAAADAAGQSVAAAVVRAVIRAHPARDERRAALRELPVEEVWRAADPEYREAVDVDQVIDEGLAEHADQFRSLIEQAAAQVNEVYGDDDDSLITEAAIAAAVLALLLALRRAVKRWFTDPDGYRPDGTPRGGGKRRSFRVPDGAVRTAMMVAAGAAVGGDGAILADGGGGVAPNEGGAWAGGTGMAVGHSVISRLRVPQGHRMAFEWRHGYWRNPLVPFQPHLDLDAHVFDSLGDIEGGWFPGDHPWCSCMAIPVITKN